MAEEIKGNPGTYETGTQGMTKRALELLGEYETTKTEGTYELTTAESQEIREAIKTAGSVRKELMQREGVAGYRPLSPQAKEILKKAYSGTSEIIEQIASKKVGGIREGYINEKIELMPAIASERRLGEKLAGIVEVAKNDFGVPSYEIEESKGIEFLSRGTIKKPLQSTKYGEVTQDERKLNGVFNDEYESKVSKIQSELREKAEKKEKGLAGLKNEVEAEAETK